MTLHTIPTEKVLPHYFMNPARDLVWISGTSGNYPCPRRQCLGGYHDYHHSCIQMEGIFPGSVLPDEEVEEYETVIYYCECDNCYDYNTTVSAHYFAGIIDNMVCGWCEINQCPRTENAIKVH